jgi:hypothetical protein
MAKASRAVLLSSALALGAAAVGCGDDTGTGAAAAESGSVQVRISGEELATDGFDFPEGSEVTFVDGWAISFDHVFVTVGRVWLSENPQTNPSDQSMVGATVAEVSGPWAVDLARGGDAPGAGGEGTAHTLVVIENQTSNDGAPFVADEQYAFSFSFVAAAEGATLVGFEDDEEAKAAYAEAIAGGYAVYYVGTATFVGTTCDVSDESYDFDSIPTTIPFRLGFSTPVDYLNCQNEENAGEPFPDEEFQRGVSIRSDAPSLAQITVHVEHPFYSDVQHEPSIYFDQLAAQLVGAPEGTVLTTEHLQGVDPTGFTDAEDNRLPWRVCDGSTLPPGAARAFEVGSVPVGPGQDPSEGFRDYRDYVQYVQSTQGHMNGGEGLCYIARQYSSPR